MKLVMLMYLADDDDCVEGLLAEHDVRVFSNLPLEGIGPGTRTGWYGKTAPYESRMTMTVVEDAQADELLQAVRDCTGVKDPRHPVRAVQVDVEAMTTCLAAEGEGGGR